MFATVRRGALALTAASFLALVPGTSLADGPAGGQDPPDGGPGPGTLCDPGTLALDPLVQAVVLITQVTLL